MKCPKCGRVKVEQIGYRNWWCVFCKLMFGDDPDEGGTHHQLR